jgi:hypothetical protein
VQAYRLYFHGDDGHIVAVQAFEGGDDEAAIERARELLDGRRVELWQQARKVTVFDAERQCAKG